MLHYGDVTKINGAEVPVVDVITFGAPCQDLSVAGKRAGMKHTAQGDEETTRSGLFFEAIRIIKEMRENDKRSNTRANEYIRPRYAVYENVPGAFSSNKGKDFQAVLTEISRIVCKDCPDVPLPEKGKWPKSGCLMGYGDDGQPFSIAYRLHDSQFWGVPQRRRRIALVADFGGTSAPEILFERESVSGNTKQGEQAGEETSGATGTGANKTGCTTELNGTLGVSQDQTLITGCKVYGISPYDSNAMKSSNPHSGIYEADTSRTLDLNGGSPACNQGGMIVLEGNGSRESHRGDGYKESETMYSLNTVEQHAICVDQGAGKSSCQVEVEKSPTLATTHDGAPAVCTYQDVTRALCASGYDKLGVQEAANDMYVVQSCAWDGSQVSPTLTANNAGGAQRMPDKENFNAVITYGVDCYNQTQAEEVTQPLRSINADSDHIPCVIAFQGQAGAEASLQVGEDLSPTLLSGKNAMVSYGLDRASFNQGQNAKYDFAIESDLSPTILAKGPGGVAIIK